MAKNVEGFVFFATLKGEALAKTLADLFDQNSLAIVRRVDSAEFLQFDSSEPSAFINHWSQGQIFNSQFEIRWRREQDSYETLLLTETNQQRSEFQAAADSPFEAVVPSSDATHGFLLWGTSKVDGGWREARIPRLLTYPIERQGEKPRLAYVLYQKSAVVRWVRLLGLKGGEANAPI